MDCADWTKIGFSTKPIKRLKMAQTHNPLGVSLAAVLLTDDAEAVEGLLHDFLHGYMNHSGGREWFQLTDDVHSDLVNRTYLLTDTLTVDWCDSLDAHLHPLQHEGTDIEASPESMLFDTEEDQLSNSDPRREESCTTCGSEIDLSGELMIQEGVSDEFRQKANKMCVNCVAQQYPAGVPIEIPVHCHDVRLTRDSRRTPKYKGRST